MKVYLAGPITGLTYEQGQDWRTVAQALLAKEGLLGYSPLRAKEYLSGVGELKGAYDIHPLSTAKGIVARDRNDVLTADAVLFNLLGAKQISIGTMIEFGWADAFRKPTVVVAEKAGNIHDHPITDQLTGFRVETLSEAVQLLSRVLLPR